MRPDRRQAVPLLDLPRRRRRRGIRCASERRAQAACSSRPTAGGARLRAAAALLLVACSTPPAPRSAPSNAADAADTTAPGRVVLASLRAPFRGPQLVVKGGTFPVGLGVEVLVRSTRPQAGSHCALAWRGVIEEDGDFAAAFPPVDSACPGLDCVEHVVFITIGDSQRRWPVPCGATMHVWR